MTSHGTLTASLAELLDDRRWLGGLARSLVGDAAAAEDLVQDTLLAAAEHRGGIASPRAWMATVMRNRARHRARAEVRRRRREAVRATDAPSPSTEAVVERFDVQRSVASAVAELAEPFRSTVLLHYYEGLSLADIARREGIPDGTVRSRLHRAHGMLQRRLAAEHGEDRWRALLLPLTLPATRRLTFGGALLAVAAVVTVTAGLVYGLWRTAPAAPISPAGAELVEVRGPVHEVNPPAVRRESVDSVESASPASTDQTTLPAVAGVPDPQQGTLHARFVDVHGAGIAGIELAVRGPNLGNLSFTLDAAARALLPTARSNADGRVTLHLRVPSFLLAQIPDSFRPAPGEPWGLELDADGPEHAPVRIETLLADGDEIDLGTVVLRDAVTVTGRVVDGDGKGIPGVEVGFVEPPFPDDCEGYAARQSAPRAVIEVETRAWVGAGEFTLEDAPQGWAMIWARKRGYRSAYRLIDADRSRIELAPLRLDPAPLPESARDRHQVSVRVVDVASHPVADASVHYRFGEGGGMTRTDQNGNATVQWFTPVGVRGPIEVLASAPAGSPHGTSEVREADPGATLQLRLGSPEPTTVEVRARASGEPVAAFHASWRGVDDGFGRGLARIDGPGRARLVPPQVTAKLRVSAKGFTTWESDPCPPGSIPAHLVVELAATPGIRGRVLAGGGEPLADAEISVLRPVEVGTGYSADGFRSLYRREGNWDAKSTADGSYHVDHAEPGRLRLLIRHADWAPSMTDWLDYAPDVGADAGEIVLAKGGRVEGVVHDRSGRPVPRAIIALNDYLGRVRTEICDRTGRYRFAHVRPGEYELRPIVERIEPGSENWTLPAEIAARPLLTNVVVLDGETTVHDVSLQSCRLLGRLTNPRFDWRGWQVALRHLHDGSELSSATILDRDGSFVLATFAPGTYRLSIRGPGGPLGTIRLDTEIELPGGVSRYEPSLTLGSLSGQIPSGAAPGRYVLIAESGHLRAEVPLRPSPDTGQFDAALVPTGRVVLVARTDAGDERLGSYEVRVR